MNHKKCKVCGALVPENGKFCPDCGAAINGKPVVKKSGKTKSTAMRDNIIIVGVIIVVAVAFIIIKSPSESEHQHVQQQQMNQMQGGGNIENPHVEGGMMGVIPNMPQEFLSICLKHLIKLKSVFSRAVFAFIVSVLLFWILIK